MVEEAMSLAVTGFRHEAALYAGPDDFVEQCGSFIRGGLAADEPVLVVVIPSKIEMLRADLGRHADRVLFKDMEQIGRNPARIIPVWHDFLEQNASAGRVRGIGEPIWAGRTQDEISESQRHEELINLAFDGFNGSILCPYDTKSLPLDVIDEAYRSHPVMSSRGEEEMSGSYRGLERIADPDDRALPEPLARPIELAITTELDGLRRFVARHAAAFGLDTGRVSDLVLAVDEVATNTLRHGRGKGVLRTWVEGDTLFFEVSDRGRIDEPLVGRERPSVAEGGFGLWIVNQVCDLVQVRTYATGSVIRIQMRRR
jgi:anti-sigma regulatory factor (Ser/Thr protein kinase)